MSTGTDEEENVRFYITFDGTTKKVIQILALFTDRSIRPIRCEPNETLVEAQDRLGLRVRD